MKITELVSYDIVSNPSYLSARLYGSFIGYIDKENINIIRKRKIDNLFDIIINNIILGLILVLK
jgi:mannitol-specific phosphotransferase system IIBC component